MKPSKLRTRVRGSTMDAGLWIIISISSLSVVVGLLSEVASRLGRSRSKRFAAFLAVIREANEIMSIDQCEAVIATNSVGQFFSGPTPPVQLTYSWPRASVTLNPALLKAVFVTPDMRFSYDIKWRNVHEFARQLGAYLRSIDAPIR